MEQAPREPAFGGAASERVVGRGARPIRRHAGAPIARGPRGLRQAARR
jgi:hypothetical protein